MKTPVELPSGKILDLTRFIALVPIGKDRGADLILSGYSSPINLEKRDADALKKLLHLDSELTSSSRREIAQEWDREEQLRQNQPLIKLLRKWREQKESQPPTEEDRREYQEIQETLKRNPILYQVP